MATKKQNVQDINFMSMGERDYQQMFIGSNKEAPLFEFDAYGVPIYHPENESKYAPDMLIDNPLTGRKESVTATIDYVNNLDEERKAVAGIYNTLQSYHRDYGESSTAFQTVHALLDAPIVGFGGRIVKTGLDIADTVHSLKRTTAEMVWDASMAVKYDDKTKFEAFKELQKYGDDTENYVRFHNFDNDTHLSDKAKELLNDYKSLLNTRYDDIHFLEAEREAVNVGAYLGMKEGDLNSKIIQGSRFVGDVAGFLYTASRAGMAMNSIAKTAPAVFKSIGALGQKTGEALAFTTQYANIRREALLSGLDYDKANGLAILAGVAEMFWEGKGVLKDGRITAKKSLINVATQYMVPEAATEMIQTGSENILKSVYGINSNTIGDIIEEMILAGIGGFLGGGIVGGIDYRSGQMAIRAKAVKQIEQQELAKARQEAEARIKENVSKTEEVSAPTQTTEQTQEQVAEPTVTQTEESTTEETQKQETQAETQTTETKQETKKEETVEDKLKKDKEYQDKIKEIENKTKKELREIVSEKAKKINPNITEEQIDNLNDLLYKTQKALDNDDDYGHALEQWTENLTKWTNENSPEYKKNMEELDKTLGKDTLGLTPEQINDLKSPDRFKRQQAQWKLVTRQIESVFKRNGVDAKTAKKLAIAFKNTFQDSLLLSGRNPITFYQKVFPKVVSLTRASLNGQTVEGFQSVLDRIVSSDQIDSFGKYKEAADLLNRIKNAKDPIEINSLIGQLFASSTEEHGYTLEDVLEALQERSRIEKAIADEMGISYGKNLSGNDFSIMALMRVRGATQTEINEAFGISRENADVEYADAVQKLFPPLTSEEIAEVEKLLKRAKADKPGATIKGAYAQSGYDAEVVDEEEGPTEEDLSKEVLYHAKSRKKSKKQDSLEDETTKWLQEHGGEIPSEYSYETSEPEFVSLDEAIANEEMQDFDYKSSLAEEQPYFEREEYVEPSEEQETVAPEEQEDYVTKEKETPKETEAVKEKSETEKQIKKNITDFLNNEAKESKPFGKDLIMLGGDVSSRIAAEEFGHFLTAKLREAAKIQAIRNSANRIFIDYDMYSLGMLSNLNPLAYLFNEIFSPINGIEMTEREKMETLADVFARSVCHEKLPKTQERALNLHQAEVNDSLMAADDSKFDELPKAIKTKLSRTMQNLMKPGSTMELISVGNTIIDLLSNGNIAEAHKQALDILSKYEIYEGDKWATALMFLEKFDPAAQLDIIANFGKRIATQGYDRLVSEKYEVREDDKGMKKLYIIGMKEQSGLETTPKEADVYYHAESPKLIEDAKNVWNRVSPKLKDALDFSSLITEYTESLSESAEKVHPALQSVIRYSEFQHNNRKIKRIKLASVVENLSKQHNIDYKNLPGFKANFKDVLFAGKEGARKQAAEWLVKQFESAGVEAQNIVRNTMEAIYDELDVALLELRGAGVDVKELSEYWPTRVADLDGLSNALGFAEPESNIGKYLAAQKNQIRYENAKSGKKMSESQITQMAINNINDKVRRGDIKDGFAGLKERQGAFSAATSEFYADPFESLVTYFEGQSRTLMMRELVGELNYETDIKTGMRKLSERLLKGQDLEGVEINETGQLGATVLKLYEQGKLDGKLGKKGALENFTKRLNQFINATATSKEGAAYWIARTNQLLLANIHNTVNQANELALIFKDFCLDVSSESINEAVQELANDMQANPESYNLETAQVEALNETIRNNENDKLRAIQDFLYKVSGFSTMDMLMKNIAVKAFMSNAIKVINEDTKVDARNKARFYDLFNRTFPEEFYTEEQRNEILNEIREGKITPDTQFLAFCYLSDIQPINSSEIPTSFLASGPLGKLFYQYKGPMIKQLKKVIRDLKIAKSISKKDFLKELFGIWLYMGAVGVLTGALQNLLRLRKPDIMENFLTSPLQLIGVNEYSINQMKQEGLFRGYLESLTPGYRVADDFAKDTYRLVTLKDYKGNLVRDIPILGPFAYYSLLGGRDYSVRSGEALFSSGNESKRRIKQLKKALRS